MLGATIGRALSIAIAGLGLEDLLVSRFNVPPGSGGGVQKLGTGFTLVSQEHWKNADGTASPGAIITLYQRSDGAFRQDTSRRLSDGTLERFDSGIGFPGRRFVKATRDGEIIEGRDEVGSGPFISLEKIESLRADPVLGYEVLGTEMLLGYQTHVVKVTKDESWAKFYIAPKLQGQPLKVESDELVLEPIGIGIGEPSDETFNVDLALEALGVAVSN